MTISNSYVIRVRHATEAQWVLADPILADGEPAYSTDANRWKIGDGISTWSQLLYVEGPQGVEGPIGPEGPAGQFANYQGSVATSEDLPGSAELGDAYLLTTPDPEEMWVYGSNGWQYAGLAGVPGPAGDEGPVGPAVTEVVVQNTQPTDPNVDFWVNPTAGLDTWGLLDDRYVQNDSDGSLSGLTIVSPSDANLNLDSGSAANPSGIFLKQDGVNKWFLSANDSNELTVDRYNPATGLFVETALTIDGDTGELKLKADPTSLLGAATKQYVDKHSYISGASGATATALTSTYTRVDFGASMTSGGDAVLLGSNLFRVPAGRWLLTCRMMPVVNASASTTTLAIGNSSNVAQVEISDFYMPASWAGRHISAFVYSVLTQTDFCILYKSNVNRNANYNTISVDYLGPN